MALSKTNPDQLIVSLSDKGIKVDASVVAKSYREEIKLKVEALRKKGVGMYSKMSFALLFSCSKLFIQPSFR